MQLDPAPWDQAQYVSLTGFSNLSRVTVGRCGIKCLESLQATLRSWNPTKASSRHLRVVFPWPKIESALSYSEGTGRLEQNVLVLEKSCGSMVFIYKNTVHLSLTCTPLHRYTTFDYQDIRELYTIRVQAPGRTHFNEPEEVLSKGVRGRSIGDRTRYVRTPNDTTI